MQFKLTGLSYSLNNEGNTTMVVANMNGQTEGSSDYLSASIYLSSADLDEGTTFDDLSKNQLQALARKKLAKLTAMESKDAK